MPPRSIGDHLVDGIRRPTRSRRRCPRPNRRRGPVPPWPRRRRCSRGRPVRSVSAIRRAARSATRALAEAPRSMCVPGGTRTVRRRASSSICHQPGAGRGRVEQLGRVPVELASKSRSYPSASRRQSHGRVHRAAGAPRHVAGHRDGVEEQRAHLHARPRRPGAALHNSESGRKRLQARSMATSSSRRIACGLVGDGRIGDGHDRRSCRWRAWCGARAAPAEPRHRRARAQSGRVGHRHRPGPTRDARWRPGGARRSGGGDRGRMPSSDW